jgi:predicted CXXCH cytochrome family protein
MGLGALAALVFGFALFQNLQEVITSLDEIFAHRESGWAKSTTCRSCHLDHYNSWHRTFHRTMTQEASPKSVVGAFDGRTMTFQGVSARPVRRADSFFVEYLNPAGDIFRSLKILRTVGSHRYQQYLVDAPNDDADNYYRIPLVWHIEEQRWIHLNGAFLQPDNLPYDVGVTLWNQNCVFCHNTGPKPGSTNYDELSARASRGEAVDVAYGGHYKTSVAELGIACEACHAPGAEHATRNRDPLRRYVLHLTGRPDPTIVNPARLSKERSVAVCGQCHGQRLPKPLSAIRTFLTEGPIYRSGEDLQASVTPLFAKTPAPGPDPNLFELRFWKDGTPRLSAYEYQGLLQSRCYREGELTCISCHTMHGGDVRGMIRPAMRTNQACRICHKELVDNVSSHSMHKAESSGSSCYECHMPKAVYGILEIHRSHRIEVPDPARDAEFARPNACTNCHSDRSALWAAEAARRWWGEAFRLPQFRGDGAPVDMSAATAALLGGDVVQRVVAASLAARSDSSLTLEEQAFLVPLLLEGLGDDYPAVRWMSRKSLLSLWEKLELPGGLEVTETFDYLAPRPQRDLRVDEIRHIWRNIPKERFPSVPPDSRLTSDYELPPADTERLRGLRETKIISIGE